MSGQLQRRDEDLGSLFIPRVDFDLAMWMAYQNCVNAPIFGKFSDSFASCVRILCSMLDQEKDGKTYTDDQYREETKNADVIGFFRAAGRLMHRKGFFDRPTKNLGHL